jgi:glycine cleavage system H protein
MSTFYTKEHEYARIEGKVATCGITNFAQEALGDVVYVSLPKVGATVKKGTPVMSVESVKAASDVYAPVSGKVIAINSSVVENPGTVNAHAESDAWFVKIEPSDASAETKTLMDSPSYKKFCEENAH